MLSGDEANSGSLAEPLFETDTMADDDPSFLSTPCAEGPPASRQTYDVGEEINGRYSFVLGERLGRGGFGAVHLARFKNARATSHIPEQVAVKFFHIAGADNPAQLLKRELSALLVLDSPYIPRVYDYSMDARSPWVAMQYFPNGSLDKHLPENGPLDTASTWLLIANLLDALTVAHRASILHLDVKPGNVLLSDHGYFVLGDFGISQAHFLHRGVIPAGLGAPLFQSPEQRRNAPVFDARTDLWGVGITAWAAYTGICSKEISEYMRYDDPDFGIELPSAVREDADDRLELLIMQLLRTRPDDRPSTAAEVRAHVEVDCGLHSVKIHDDPRIEKRLSLEQAKAVVGRIFDPLWAAVADSSLMLDSCVQYEDGEVLCDQGDASFFAFILLNGMIQVERDRKVLRTETREGAFFGEVPVLTGRRCNATLRARGKTSVAVLSCAELEWLIVQYPAIGIRLVRTLADRLSVFE